jgi:hypothetical protein
MSNQSLNIPINAQQWQTDEFPLALTMVMIGVPWADENCRMQNIYTAEFLRKIGKTVEEAKAAGIPGDKQFWIFKFTDECQAAIPLFRQVWDSKTQAEDFPAISIPDAVRLCALVLKNRGILAQDFKNHTAKVSIPRGPMGEMTILCPNTPKEGREQMGIQS